MQISSIHVYPVKSCGGIELQEADLGLRGLKFDRHWMVVDEQGQKISQREQPRMSLIKTELNGEDVVLCAEGKGSVRVPGRGVQTREVSLWDDHTQGTDAGDDAAKWMSDFLATACRLVFMAQETVRPVDAKYLTTKHQVGFADGYPLLIMTTASLDALNDLMEVPVSMNRFRPNLVVSGSEAFAEDKWKTIRAGELIIHLVKPCARCVMVNVDQELAHVSKEPLRTLSTFRQKGQKVLYGQNGIHEKPGRIAVNDTVEVLEYLD